MPSPVRVTRSWRSLATSVTRRSRSSTRSPTAAPPEPDTWISRSSAAMRSRSARSPRRRRPAPRRRCRPASRGAEAVWRNERAIASARATTSRRSGPLPGLLETRGAGEELVHLAGDVRAVDRVKVGLHDGADLGAGAVVAEAGALRDELAVGERRVDRAGGSERDALERADVVGAGEGASGRRAGGGSRAWTRWRCSAGAAPGGSGVP